MSNAASVFTCHLPSKAWSFRFLVMELSDGNSLRNGGRSSTTSSVATFAASLALRRSITPAMKKIVKSAYEKNNIKGLGPWVPGPLILYQWPSHNIQRIIDRRNKGIDIWGFQKIFCNWTNRDSIHQYLGFRSEEWKEIVHPYASAVRLFVVHSRKKSAMMKNCHRAFTSQRTF